MKLIQIVFLAGSHCISPVEHMQGLSEVSKVPCAIIVNRDTESNVVTTEPPGLSALPEVVAVLDPPAATAKPRPFYVQARPQQPQIRIIPASDTETAEETAKAPAKKTRVAAASADKPPKRKHSSALLDRCGSYKAIWYTAKSGARRYRCVRQG